MTGRHDCSGPSRREVKNNVWKYLKTIVIGLYAVSEQELVHRNRALSLRSLNRIGEQRNFFGPSNILDPGVSVQAAASIRDFARALIWGFNFVGKIRVIPSIMHSILFNPIPAISRSHICAPHQFAALDVTGVERGIKLMSPPVRMGVSAFRTTQ